MKVADVTVEQLRDYNDKLSAIRSEAGNYFKKLACAQDLLKLGEEEQKSAIYHAAVDAVNSFTDAAGSAACDFFDAHVTGAQPSSIAPQPWFIKRRLYENIEKYAKTHKLGDDEFMRLLAEEVGGEVVQHANRTTIHNAVKNNLHYARVPFGNSCAFCLMLASRGFVYKTETTAGEDKGHYHAHCRCKIVAGKKDTKIGDHNPEKLNQRMMQIAKELDITNFNWEDYISDKAMQDLLQQEVRLRDKDWLLTGKPPEVDYSNNPRENYGIRKVENNDYSKENFKKRGNEWRDLFVHDTLAKNGYKVQPQGGADIDLRINGQPWEVKSPIPTRDSNSGSLRWVENNVKAANTQFKKRGINGETSLILSGYYYATDDAVIEKELVKRARQHKVKRVMFIDKTGNIKRLI